MSILNRGPPPYGTNCPLPKNLAAKLKMSMRLHKPDSVNSGVEASRDDVELGPRAAFAASGAKRAAVHVTEEDHGEEEDEAGKKVVVCSGDVDGLLETYVKYAFPAIEVADEDDLAAKGIRMPILLVYQLAFVAVFVSLFLVSYTENIGTKYLSPISEMTSNCETTQKPLTAQYYIDKEGNWEGDEDFSYLRVLYKIEFYDAQLTPSQFRTMTTYFENQIQRLAEKQSQTSDMAWNLLAWSGFRTSYIGGSTALTEIEGGGGKVAPGLGTVTFYPAGDASKTFAMDLNSVYFANNASFCTLKNYTKSYDAALSEYKVIIPLNISRGLEAELAEEPCPGIFEAGGDLFFIMPSENQTDLVIDVRSLVTALAFNYGLIGYSDLSHARELEMDDDTSETAYHFAVNTRYPGMDPIPCTKRLCGILVGALVAVPFIVGQGYFPVQLNHTWDPCWFVQYIPERCVNGTASNGEVDVCKLEYNLPSYVGFVFTSNSNDKSAMEELEQGWLGSLLTQDDVNLGEEIIDTVYPTLATMQMLAFMQEYVGFVIEENYDSDFAAWIPGYNGTTCSFGNYMSIAINKLCPGFDCGVMLMSFSRPLSLYDFFHGVTLNDYYSTLSYSSAGTNIETIYRPIVFERMREELPIPLVDDVVTCSATEEKVLYDSLGISFANAQLACSLVLNAIVLSLVFGCNFFAKRTGDSHIMSIDDKDAAQKQAMLILIQELIERNPNVNRKRCQRLINAVSAMEHLEVDVHDKKKRSKFVRELERKVIGMRYLNKSDKEADSQLMSVQQSTRLLFVPPEAHEEEDPEIFPEKQHQLDDNNGPGHAPVANDETHQLSQYSTNDNTTDNSEKKNAVPLPLASHSSSTGRLFGLTSTPAPEHSEPSSTGLRKTSRNQLTSPQSQESLSKRQPQTFTYPIRGNKTMTMTMADSDDESTDEEDQQQLQYPDGKPSLANGQRQQQQKQQQPQRRATIVEVNGVKYLFTPRADGESREGNYNISALDDVEA